MRLNASVEYLPRCWRLRSFVEARARSSESPRLAALDALPPTAASADDPLQAISRMTRPQLEAALRVARLDGLVDDLWPALERLRVQR